MTRIAVADEDTWFVEGLKNIIAAQPDMRVVHATTGIHELVDLARRRDVEIIIFGLDDPSELLKAVAPLPSAPSVLVLADTADASHSGRLLRSGAAGILPRRCEVDQLGLALRTLASGQRFLPPEVLEKLLAPSTEREPHDTLSQREYQVFLALARGTTVGDLAKSLRISVKSAMTYRTRLMEKMHLKSNSDLTYYALKRGLIT
jgi:two-component system invasion response regulator UvrY